MIASFSRNFIFARTRKTASTSTEIVLGAWCGPGDVVTPVGVDDEITRLGYGGRPMNFSTDPTLEAEYVAALSRGRAEQIKPLYARIMKSLDYHHHMSAEEIKARVPADFWARAFKFSTDRHPYEKAVSLAFWRSRNKGLDEGGFADFLQQTVDNGEYRNFDIYAIDGKVAVDRVLRHETLWDDLAEVAAHLGVSLPRTRPQAKAQHRKNRAPARNILSPEQKLRVQSICAEEFALFDYDPA